MELYRLGKKELNKAAEILGKAYMENPALHYMIPEKEKLRKKIKELFKVQLRLRFQKGEIYASSPNLEGVIAWECSDNFETTFIKLLKAGGLSLILKIGIAATKRVLSVVEFYDSLHLQHMKNPHWLLGPFGVDPPYQGKGIGGSMLRTFFEIADNSQFPIYLYTDKEKNYMMYLHMGFQLVEKAIYPDGNFPLWFMIRQSK